MKIKPALLTFLFGLTVTSNVNATLITDRTEFEGLLTSMIIDDYESDQYAFVQSDAEMSAVLAETQYMSTGFQELNLVVESADNYHYCAGCNGSFLLDFTETSVGDASGVFGVGFDFFNDDIPQYNGLVTYGNGTTENILFDSTFYPDMEFFGITSELGISSIHFGLVDGGTTTAGSFGLDNLTIGSAVQVPEPLSLALFGLGLAGIGFSRKKKNS